MSASELRRRYHKGGTAKDSELSASQIRSRHNIENTKFSGGPVGAGGGNQMTLIIIAAVVLLLGGAAFFFSK